MRFTHPLDDHILTRGFYYLSSLYIGGQHAAGDYIRRLAPTRASPAKAIADWEAVGVGWDFYSGFFVALDHAGGWRSFYRHLYGQSPVVVGQQGLQGQIIGNIGNTGASEGDHLHFDLRNAVKQDATAFAKHGIWAHDPELYLGQEDDMAMTKEQDDMLKTINHYVQVVEPEERRHMHHHLHVIIPELIKGIKVTGGGATADEIADKIAARMRA